MMAARSFGEREAMTSKNNPSGADGLGIWRHLGVWIAFGSALGVLAGVFFGNIGLGIALGTALGVAVGSAFIARGAGRKS
jgi:hypothetical protein